MTTISKFRWFWAWDDEKEETWLGEMARQGWHLQVVRPVGNYTFEAGEPRDVAYRLDFFTDHKNKESYLQLFQDAGWEHVGEYGSWQYFRKPVLEGEPPEIFTDNESKIKKYQRVMVLLAVLLPIYIPMLNSLNRRPGILFGIMTFIVFVIMVLFGYSLAMLLRRINQLRKV